MESMSTSTDAYYSAIIDRASGSLVGYASLHRVGADNRVIEVGNILFLPQLQRTPGVTECMYLLTFWAMSATASSDSI